MGYPIASKTYTMTSGDKLNLSVTNDMYCTKELLYKTTMMESITSVIWNHSGSHIQVNYTIIPTRHDGKCALYLDSRTEVQAFVFFESQFNSGHFQEDVLISWDGGSSQQSFDYIGSPGYPINNTHGDVFWSLTTNIPIFATEQEAIAYVNAADEATEISLIQTALNYQDVEYDQDETEYYQISNRWTTADLFQGNPSPVSGATKYERSTIFKANTPPVLYFDEESFELKLLAKDIVCGYSVAGPISAVEQVPETSWIPQSTRYNGSYYGGVSDKDVAGWPIPADGTYLWGSYLWTNVYIAKNKADAEEALETGDYTKMGNYNTIQHGGFGLEPTFGTEETTTTFGDGTFASPFARQYVMSASGVRDVASIFFSDDQGLIDDLKKGLELFGAKPVDCIMSLVAFPFDVSTICTCSSEYDIYFGSYKHHLNNPVNKIGNFNAVQKYIDAGTITLKPIFHNYRDFKNLTLSVYMPFIGWNELDVEKYVGKSVNARYYVDINTRQCVAMLVANGVMADYWTGEIGVELPVVGSNFSEYARSELQHIESTAKRMLNPANLETLTNLAGGSLGMFKFGQNGSPKDMQMVKGSFSSGVGMYLPQYVIFRYDIHDIAEPELLNELCGKPSTASGKIGNFSGFLSGRVTKMNTSGMLQEEIDEMHLGIMSEGIYI